MRNVKHTKLLDAMLRLKLAMAQMSVAWKLQPLLTQRPKSGSLIHLLSVQLNIGQASYLFWLTMPWYLPRQL